MATVVTHLANTALKAGISSSPATIFSSIALNAQDTLIVTFSALSTAAGAITGVTWNSIALTKAITEPSSSTQISIWTLNVATGGTGNIVVSATTTGVAYAISADKATLLNGNGSLVDQTAVGTGTSGAPATAATTTTTNANDLLWGAHVMNGPTGDTDVTTNAGNTGTREQTNVGTSGSSATTNIYMDVMYGTVAATGAYKHSWSGGTSRIWAAVIAALKQAVAPAPTSGTLTFTGGALGARLQVGVVVAALALSGLAPSLTIGPMAKVPSASLVLGDAPASIQTTVETIPGSLVFSSLAPTPTITNSGVQITVPTGSTTVVGLAPTLGSLLLVPTGSLTFQGQTPAMQRTVSPGAVSLTFQLLITKNGVGTISGTVMSGGSLSGGTVTTTTLTRLAPTLVIRESALKVPAGTLGLTGQSLSTRTLVSISSSTLVLAGTVPETLTNVAIPSGRLLVRSTTPGIRCADIVGTTALVFTDSIPTVQVTENILFGTLAFTGLAPSLHVIDSVASAALTFTGTVPSLNGSLRISIPAGTLVLTGNGPTDQTLVVVALDRLSLAGRLPAVQFQARPPAGSVVFTGLVPTPSMTGVDISVPSGAALVTGNSPVLRTTVGLSTGRFNLSGLSPDSLLAVLIAPGTVVFTGSTSGLFTQVSGAGATLLLTPLPPSVQWTESSVTGTLTFTGVTPTTTITGVQIAPPGGSLTLGTNLLSMQLNQPVPSVAVVFTGLVPVVHVGAGATLTPATAALTWSSVAPNVRMNLPVATAAIQVALTTPAVQAQLSVGSVSLQLTGTSTVLDLLVAISQPGTLTFTGSGPALKMLMSVPADNLTLAGSSGALQLRVFVPGASLILTDRIVRSWVRVEPSGALMRMGGLVPTVLVTGVQIVLPIGGVTLTGGLLGSWVRDTIPAAELAFTGLIPHITRASQLPAHKYIPGTGGWISTGDFNGGKASGPGTTGRTGIGTFVGSKVLRKD